MPKTNKLLLLFKFVVFAAGGWWRGTLGKVAIRARIGSSRKGEVESCEVES